MAKINFGGVEETVVMRKEFSLAKARRVLKKEVVAVIGYGVQGPAQALNMRDNGVNVIVGQRQGSSSWDRAMKDGWGPGKTMLSIEEAAERGTIVQLQVADSASKAVWPTVAAKLTAGKALCFSHGFGLVYNDLTGIKPGADVDVMLVAPKGSGTSVRRNFLNGVGINSSYAVAQDATGKAEERCMAMGISIGSGYLFPTTFENEVTSDLVGERGVLMGALAGIMEAQYDVLRKNGHSPSEAFNETVEELTQSLIRLVDENGMDWMYANCSATAQRGALDWLPKFKKATLPVFRDLYKAVKSKQEAARVMRTCSGAKYKERLQKELNAMGNSEMWQAGKACRALRPKDKAHANAATAAGVKGRAAN